MYKINILVILFLSACNNYYPCQDERLTALEFKQFRQIGLSYYHDDETPIYSRIDKNLDSVYLAKLDRIKVPVIALRKDTIRKVVIIFLSGKPEFPMSAHSLKMVIPIDGYDMNPSLYDNEKEDDRYELNCFEQAFEEIWLLSETRYN